MDDLGSVLLPAFKLSDVFELQDLFCSLLLSECVYKAQDQGPDAAVTALISLKQQLPSWLAPLHDIQFCRRRVNHRYLLARTHDALYVAFQGTKELRDMLVDLTVTSKALWTDINNSNSSTEAVTNNLEIGQKPEIIPTVHGGFLARSEHIPIEALFQHAQRQNLRLVLCGHSLGGAVAILSTLRLLSLIDQLSTHHQLRCICFGTPALGSPALATHIDARGWQRHFASYALPDDPIPRLLLATATTTTSSSSLGPGGDDDVVDKLLKDETEGDNPSINSTEEDAQFQSMNSGGGEEKAMVRDNQAMQLLRNIVQRTAGTLPSFPVLYPTFSHFGQPLYLLPTGVSPTLPPTIQQDPVEVLDEATTSSSTRWLGRHRMPAYRHRVLSACRRVATAAGIDWNSAIISDDTTSESGGRKGIVMAQLAPEMRAVDVQTELPVLWSGPWSDVIHLNDNTPPSSKSRTAVASSNNNDNTRENTRSKYSLPPPPRHTSLSITVTGFGFEICNGALLTFEHHPGVQFRAARMQNGARLTLERQLADLGATLSPSLDSHQSSLIHQLPHRAAETAGKLLELVGLKPHHQNTTTATVETPGKLILTFELPTYYLLHNTTTNSSKEPKAGSDHAMRLVLLSDFNKQPTPVNPTSRTTWLFGSSASLCAAVHDEIRTLAKESTQEVLHHQPQRKRRNAVVANLSLLPSVFGKRDLEKAAGFGFLPSWLLRGGRKTADKTIEQVPSSVEKDKDTEEESSSSNRIDDVTQQQQQTYRISKAIQFVTALPNRVGTSLFNRAFGSTQQHQQQQEEGFPKYNSVLSNSGNTDLPQNASVLLRGVSVLNTSFLLPPDGVSEHLKLVSDVLAWKSRLDRYKYNAISCTSRDDENDSSFRLDIEAAEEEADFEQLKGTTNKGNMGQKIRNKLHQAGRGASNAMAIFKNRKTIMQLARPDIVVIIVHIDDLISYTKENTAGVITPDWDFAPFRTESLSALYKCVQAAVNLLGCAPLVGVASRIPPPAAFRRRLQYSLGLHTRPGSVVPIRLVEVGGENVQDGKKNNFSALEHQEVVVTVPEVGLLAAGILAYAEARQRESEMQRVQYSKL